VATPSRGLGLESLRSARVLHDRVERMAQIATPAVLVVVFATSLEAEPQPGWSGVNLVVLMALVGFMITSAMSIYSRGAPRRRFVTTSMALLSSLTLAIAQPSGLGLLGAGITASMLLRLVSRRLARVGVPIVVVVVVVASLLRPPVFSRAFLSILAVGLVVALVMLAQRMRLAVDRAEELLVATERTRRAERQAARLQERQQLAREMHDVLAHSLSGLALQLEGARLLAKDRAADPELAAVIERAQSLARSGLGEARRAIGMLRDDDLPGSEKLAGLLRSFVDGTGIAGDLRVDGQQRRLPAEAELALYRVTQEALTNIVKHAAHAERVDITLSYGARGVRLRVTDRGLGWSPAAAPCRSATVPAASGGGHGLRGMRERAELLGGTLHAGPTADGFVVELEVPA
jgi:signal transduction histidine kinase